MLSPRWDSINVEFELQIATTDVPFQKCKQDEACGICERGVSLCNWILFKETSSHKLCSEQQRYCSHDKNHHSVNGGDAIELYCMIFYICGYKPYRFLDTQVSLAPTHVSPLVILEFPLPLNISVQQSSSMTTPPPPKKKHCSGR